LSPVVVVGKPPRSELIAQPFPSYHPPSPTIYANLGYTGNTVLLINGISGLWGLIVTFCFITFLVDRIGRRRPLIFGGFAMAVCLAWQAGIGSLFAKPGFSNAGAGIAGTLPFFPVFKLCPFVFLTAADSRYRIHVLLLRRVFCQFRSRLVDLPIRGVQHAFTRDGHVHLDLFKL
jgi:hypothetical protein